MFSIFTRTTLFFERQEIWFYDESNVVLKGNNLFIHALNYPSNSKAKNIKKVYTTSIDITKSLDEIKSDLKTKLRGYINKAEKVDFKHQILNVLDSQVQETIFEEYNIFAKSKGITLLNEKVLKLYCDSGKMIAMKIMFENKPLITHVYLNDTVRTSLMYSFFLKNVELYDGQFRSLANRYLHWLDLLYFKQHKFIN